MSFAVQDIGSLPRTWGRGCQQLLVAAQERYELERRAIRPLRASP